MAPQEDALRLRVYNFYAKYIDRGKVFTVNHFSSEGIPRRTIYSILQRYCDGTAAERRRGSGRKATVFTPKNLKRLAKMLDGSAKVSIRTAAPKFNAHPSSLHKALRTKTAIRYHKKTSIPARTDVQIALAKTKCGRLLRKFSKCAFIVDDESYFTFSHSTLSGNAGYYSSNVSTTSTRTKFSRKKKFEEKVLVWIAIGPKGLSQPFIHTSKLAVNAQRYLSKCVRRRLIPYIRRNYSDGEYVFWPDQASSHYAKVVLDHLTAQKITFVEKQDNPANVPEIRPIEDFWSYLKSLVYAGGWEAKTRPQLVNRIKYCLKHVDQDRVHELGVAAKHRIDFVRRHGVIETR